MGSIYDIICFQEHWLHDFQKHSIELYFKNKDTNIVCSDTVDQISGLNLPRGKGGVGIAWPSAISGKVNKINEGNERIIGITISANPKILILCIYMPSNNNSVNSASEYYECLDILHHIINKYDETHEIIISGDFNGTLLNQRNGNKHDILLQKF